MSILRDEDIYKLIKEDNKLISSGLPEKEVTFEDKSSPIQPSSLDLRVGDIFVPPEDPGRRYVRPASPNKHIIKPGETVVVTTQEVLDLPEDIAAIGFPPSNMAVNGLLMTNPGHIDPGYKGRMHLTMINMGRQEYGLRRGDPVVTLLFFRLDEKVASDYQSRLSNAKVRTSSLEERKRILDVLRNLAPDFMNFKSRAGEIAQQRAQTEVKKAEHSLNLLKIWSAIIGALVTIAIGYWNFQTSNTQSDLQARVKVLENRPKIEEELDDLRRIDLLIQERVEQLEVSTASGNPQENNGESVRREER